ncbi:ubiquitin-conjugating enzyme/RWD-like protein [Flagelloscypha sp. PMI_526]|nr:ubiquitin-conjugating enzyme/RWD-like protein [Flagelloscypha sp. PMI_526]
MSEARLRRVNKEIADVRNDKTSGVTIELADEDSGSVFHLKGTPYHKGTFSMKFLTKVYHPNISSASGAICLDILKDAWSPVLTLKSTLISLQSLLCSPEPNDPQDAEVAKHYTTDRASFEETARYWTEIYAGAPATEASSSRKATSQLDDVAAAGLNPAHVDQFTNMGFERPKVIEVLKRLNYRGANVANVSSERVVEECLKD